MAAAGAALRPSGMAALLFGVLLLGPAHYAQAVRIDSSAWPADDTGTSRQAADSIPFAYYEYFNNETNGLGARICVMPSRYADVFGWDSPALDNQNMTRLVLDYASEPAVPAAGPNGVTASDVVAWAAAKFYDALPGLNTSSTFRVQPLSDNTPANDWVDAQGVRHVRIEQFVPLINAPMDLGAIIVHLTTADSKPVLVTGGVYNPWYSQQTRRSASAAGGEAVTDAQAASVALSAVLAANPGLSADAVARMRAAIAAPSSAAAMSAAGASPTTRRVVYCGQQGGCEAAYKQAIFVPSRPTPQSVHIWVSAATGKVLWAANRLQTQSAPKLTASIGQGRGLYIGRTTPVLLPTGAVPGRRNNTVASYTLQDLVSGLRTMDLNGGNPDFLSKAKAYTGRKNTWGDGTWRSRATLAVDVHYGLANTLDYYLDVHARKSFDGRGGAVAAFTYAERNYDNAYYYQGGMYFGSGSLNPRFWRTKCSNRANGYAPLVTLDVAAHELTHGVTDYSSGLNYFHSSGGINEAMSDIMAMCVVQWSYEAGRSTNPADFKLGSGMFKPANCTPDAFRWMYNPPLDRGRSFGCWDPRIDSSEPIYNAEYSQNYVCEVDVHHSSGIANRAFYLATAGLNSSSNNGSLPAAIGFDKACKVFYRANTAYLAPSSDYFELRLATARAARDLYGPGAPEIDAITAAWDIVGAPTAPFPSPATPECDATFGTSPDA